MSKNTNQDSNHSKIDIEKGVEETSDTTVTREVLKAKIRTGPYLTLKHLLNIMIFILI
jgi:hypothetical protein